MKPKSTHLPVSMGVPRILKLEGEQREAFMATLGSIFADVPSKDNHHANLKKFCSYSIKAFKTFNIASFLKLWSGMKQTV